MTRVQKKKRFYERDMGMRTLCKRIVCCSDLSVENGVILAMAYCSVEKRRISEPENEIIIAFISPRCFFRRVRKSKEEILSVYKRSPPPYYNRSPIVVRLPIETPARPRTHNIEN